MKFDKRIVLAYGIWTAILTGLAAFDVVRHQWAMLVVMLILIGFNAFMVMPSMLRLAKGDYR
jgi:hypothetical protein